MKRKIGIITLTLLLMIGVTGCSLGSKTSETASTKTNTIKGGFLTSSEVFTERDLDQTIDTSDATTYTVSDGNNISITKEGTYVIKGSAKNVTITVSADSTDKVEIILENVTIENTSAPCIYVKSADKVFITTTGENNLSVTGTFTADGTTNTDAVIFSKEDIVLKGNGSLNINSTGNGITSKDDLKITGGTITITCQSDALEANDSIAIAEGEITINTKKDGLHAEYEDDTSVGYVYIAGGNLNITASDDAIHATTLLQIDGGTIKTNSKEGFEATYVQINGGTINLTASDDGINGTTSSTTYETTVEFTGGETTINMGSGDTDAVDSNGNLIITGGTINITAQSPFDYDGELTHTGGTILVNGQETDEIANQMMGGGQGGPGKQRTQSGRR